MKLATLCASVLALAFLTASATARDNWQVIGSVVFDDPFLRTAINVAPTVGPLNAVRFEVQGADVEIASIKVMYGNGQTEEVQVRDMFKAGSASRVIPLPGGNRMIKQVTVIYRSHGPARFNILGNAASAPPAWAQLGCQPVGFLIDHDSINVGRKEGAFSAIKLRVAGAPVEFLDVNVVYGNGQRETLRVRSVIPPGGETRPLDLAGKARGINHIDLLYRAVPTLKGRAVVCADGLLQP